MISQDLLDSLIEAEKEIRRLHMLHGGHYAGKLGEPDLSVADRAKKAIAAAKKDLLPCKRGTLNKYNVATAVGGWTGQPEVTYENHDIIEATTAKKAVEIYNKKHKCSYCYGHVLSQIEDKR